MQKNKHLNECERSRINIPHSLSYLLLSKMIQRALNISKYYTYQSQDELYFRYKVHSHILIFPFPIPVKPLYKGQEKLQKQIQIFKCQRFIDYVYKF